MRGRRIGCGGGVASYWRERRGRTLIQAKMPMAANINVQGENRICRATLTTITATMAMRTRARMAGMVIGLRSFRRAGALGERERIWRLAIRTAAAGRGGRPGV